MAIGQHPIVKKLGSFKLAVFSLTAMALVVFIMTLAQVKLGIFVAKKQYFDAWFLWFDAFGFPIPYFLGGKTLGLMIVINIAAATLRMPFAPKKIGLWLIHVSVIVLLVGGGWISMVAEESQMAIEEGQTSWYSESMYEVELALLSVSGEGRDRVVSIPETRLIPGQRIAIPETSLVLTVLELYPNSRIDLAMPGQAPSSLVTQGVGTQLVIQAQPPVNRDDYRNLLTAFVRVQDGDQELGVWALSNGIAAVQTFQADQTHYRFQIRPRRHYNDYGVHLEKFTREMHPGTTIPSLFSSRVRVLTPDGGHRDALIEMNKPLRFQGKTYFQASYGKEDTLTILQVVENPGWLLPYISCVGITFGMFWHFGAMLLRRRMAVVLVLLGLAVSGPLYGMTVDDAATIPVVHEGRLKPIDTLARASLLAINEKQTLRLPDGKKMEALSWLFTAMYAPATANALPVFRVQHHLILGLLGKSGEENVALSFNEISPYLSVITEEANRASEIEAPNRTDFQREIVRLYQKMAIYQKLKNTVAVEGHPHFFEDLGDYMADLDTFRPLAAAHMQAGETSQSALATLLRYFRMFRFMGENAEFLVVGTAKEPVSFGDQALDLLNGPDALDAVTNWQLLGQAYHTQDQASFDKAAQNLSVPTELTGTQRTKIKLEVFLNRANPLLWAMVAYVITMIVAALSWGIRRPTLGRMVRGGLIVGVGIQTVALLLRMWLSGRPPVTNLYTSAVFVGWIAVLMSVFLEWRTRSGISGFVGAAVGFCTLIVAHHLALQGDTLEMMQAVLDSNFWLSTHVVTVCIGYGATFFAGALGVVYILRGIFDREFSQDHIKSMAAMVYGTVCFALFFSFVGTVLGGIWADQSWGRFWGWDPKENGALLIVLWTAMILHARMGGYIRTHGLMMLAVVGNIITSFSWFGVNLLGIGLHSYGFMEKGFIWLSVFIFSQLLVLWLGSLPKKYWRSQQ